MIEFLGNNVGFIYPVDSSGNIIGGGYENTPINALAARMNGLTNSPPVGERLAYAVQEVSSTGSDTITSITINGVNQISSSVAISGVVATDIAAVAAMVNSSTPASGPNYTIKVQGSTMTWFASPSTGTTANGDAIAYTLTTPSNFTLTAASDTIIHSGSDPSLGYDTRKFMAGTRTFLDPTVTAVKGTLSASAFEITESLNLTGVQGATDIQTVTLTGNTITYTRKQHATLIIVQGGGGNLDVIIGNGATSGDTILLVGAGAGNGFTARDVSVSTTTGENLYLDNQTSYVSEGTPNFISLIYYNDPVNGFVYGETGRTNNTITAGNVRAVAGTALRPGNHEITVPNGGGSFALTPGNTGSSPNGYNNLLLQGSPTLTSGYTVTVDPTDAVAGDQGWISGTGSAIDINGNTLTVCGYSINAQIALTGAWRVDWSYDGSSLHYNLSTDPQKADWIIQSMIADDAVGTAQITDLNVTTAKINDLGVTTAKIDDLAVTTAKIAANAVDQTKLSAALQASLGTGVNVSKITIATGDVLTLNATPVQLVGPQGVGTVVDVLDVVIRHNFIGVAYATNTNVVVRTIGSGGYTFRDTTIISNGYITIQKMIPRSASLGSGAVEMIEDTGIEISVEAGNPTAGTGSIDVYTFWRTITL